LNRNLYVALGVFAAATIFAGCGGGGATIGNNPISSPTLAPGVTPSPTPMFSLAPGASPTPVPTGATPSPTPTVNIGANGAVYHPGDNGDAFTMNGTLLVTYNRANEFPTPEPTSTTFDTVSQSITVTNPASFQGTSGVEFAISETDNQTAPAPQTFSETTDQYYQYSNNMVAGSFLDLGYTLTDDTGYTVTQVNGTDNQLADKLPEMSGDTWTNTASRTISTNDGNGETSSTTYAADGSYTGTITYENLNPSPNPTGSQLTNQATLTAKTDGSALLVTPRDGTELQYNSTYTFNAPTTSGSSGTITVDTNLAPAAGSTSTPSATSTTVPNWMPAMVPGSLTSETDVDNGPVALPSPCAAAEQIPGSPNQVVQNKTNVDPLNGVLDVTTTTTYDTANVGPVCVVYHDVSTAYYDTSGQNGASYFFGVPLQVTTTDEVLTLATESLQTIKRHPAINSRTAILRSVNIALGRARIEAMHMKARQRKLDALVRPRTFRDSLRTYPGANN
jgi:hypothetical protein